MLSIHMVNSNPYAIKFSLTSVSTVSDLVSDKNADLGSASINRCFLAQTGPAPALAGMRIFKGLLVLLVSDSSAEGAVGDDGVLCTDVSGIDCSFGVRRLRGVTEILVPCVPGIGRGQPCSLKLQEISIEWKRNGTNYLLESTCITYHTAIICFAPQWCRTCMAIRACIPRDRCGLADTIALCSRLVR